MMTILDIQCWGDLTRASDSDILTKATVWEVRVRSKSEATKSLMIPEMLTKAPVARRTFLAEMVSPDSNVNTNSPVRQSRVRPLTPDLRGSLRCSEYQVWDLMRQQPEDWASTNWAWTRCLGLM